MSTGSRSGLLLRYATLLLALALFWVSGGATLRHTDPPPVFAVGHSATRHATAPAPEIPCAACEWEQAFSTPHTPTMTVLAAPLVYQGHADGLTASLYLCRFDNAAPRGPPTSLA